MPKKIARSETQRTFARCSALVYQRLPGPLLSPLHIAALAPPPATDAVPDAPAASEPQSHTDPATTLAGVSEPQEGSHFVYHHPREVPLLYLQWADWKVASIFVLNELAPANLRGDAISVFFLL